MSGMPPRSEWPRDVLKRVLSELSHEVPRHLLARDLWGNSASAVAWWARQKRYSRSMAVSRWERVGKT